MLIRTDSRRPPAVFAWATALLVTACAGVTIWQATLPPEAHGEFMRRWGAVPATFFGAGDWRNWQPAGTLVTALFVHADPAHLLGNLAYLLLFGFAVERALGSVRFLLLYLACGALANLAAAWQLGGAAVSPVIGSSGAVSAVIGAYLTLFPRARMGILLPLGLFIQFVHVPVLLVIGSWVTLQLLYTWMGPAFGAIAWWAHVAGFLAGLLVTLPAGPGTGDRRLRTI